MLRRPEKSLVGIFGLAPEPTGGGFFQALHARICPSLGPDCNANGVEDALDISGGSSKDCNGNGIPDECDIAHGTSLDVDSNGIPDDCPRGGLRIPGDSNGDGTLDISDAVALLGFLFLGKPEKLPCGDGSAADPANLKLADSNGDGAIDLSDAVSILSSLFLGGRSPALGTECVRIVGCMENAGCQ